MIKSLTKSFVVCGCIAGMMIGNSWGMEERNESLEGLIGSGAEISPTQIGLSKLIIVKEEEHAIKVTTIEQLRGLTKELANKLESVTFEGLEINGEFVDKFWELFPRGIRKLTFNGCKLINGCSFADLFSGEYHVINLRVMDCSIETDELLEALFRVDPYMLDEFVCNDNKAQRLVSQKLSCVFGSSVFHKK